MSVLIYPFPKDPSKFCRVLFFSYICKMKLELLGLVLFGLGLLLVITITILFKTEKKD